MMIPKTVRVAIFSKLFKEGVMVAEKDVRPTTKHEECDCSNLYVLNLLKSLKSRGYVREQYNWNHFYWFLTNEGIEYLREYLHLPEEIVPATLKRRPGASDGERPSFGGDRGRGDRGDRGDRGGRGRGFGGKEGAPSGSFRPQFGEGNAGASRGRPADE